MDATANVMKDPCSEQSKSTQKDPTNRTAQASVINVPSTKPKSIKRSKSSKEEEVTPKKQRSEKRPSFSVRFDQIKHFPTIDKTKLTRCKNENCDKKSYIICSKCQVHLCINVTEGRNCFTEFHTIEKNNT